MTGWTWDYVDSTLTAPRLKALHREWQRHPPLAIMIAAYLGVTVQEIGTPQDLASRLAGMAGVKQG